MSQARGRRLSPPLAFLAFSCLCHPSAAQAQDSETLGPETVPRRCVAHVISVPLVSGWGSPAVPVTINGTQGVAFLGLTQENIGVFQRPGMTYPMGRKLDVQTIAGGGHSYLTTIDSLALGRGRAGKVRGIMLGSIGDRRLDGRPVLAVLGYDILGNYDVLLDFPGQSLTLFRETGAPNCPALTRLAGAHAYQAPLLPNREGMDTMVQVAIGGVPVGMELEPGSNASILRTADATDTGVTPSMLDDDPRSRTDAGPAIIGRRHAFARYVLGGYRGTGLLADVTPATTNILGMNFFRGRRVLFAFPTRMLYFSDPQPPPPGMPADGGFSPAQSRLAETTVQDRPAPP
ncbi:pepsin/retropepsin-like aspartic protease family protein [Nguyenibacter sp. L1]|uniref:pepsin/retropepsin-like aspartic protease family protein n=1 Tax=Nguyenibacter sp. L1 TaxID=3049350 RepID=UPI002B479A2A|nr:pepsin/retropepsin-like aspartic protease family protein [Nguyenibacter sp. L1]WRH89612.1 pepsin/retropepsin-like aspartic protease family protein [Nguyenibacter sp. L1]